MAQETRIPSVLDAQLGKARPGQKRADPGRANELAPVVLRALAPDIAFLHRESRTLILCDFVFNFGATADRLTCLVMKLLRSYWRFGSSRLDPLLIRDRPAARESLGNILAWGFDRVVVAHGDVLESGGRATLRDGYAWPD